MNNKHSFHNFIFFLIGAIFLILYVFFRPQATAFWNSSIERMDQFSTNSFSTSLEFFKNLSFPRFGIGGDDAEVAVVSEKTAKDCGTTKMADLNNPSTYENNAVLNCLGDNARVCNPAKGVLENDVFPTVFEVIEGNECNFKLSYPANSTLASVDSKKLAGQYIMCPLNIVKSLKEEQGDPVFSEPSRTNADKYAVEIYHYGTIGLFVENNLDKNMVKSKGCSGSYIDSIIKSYQSAQS